MLLKDTIKINLKPPMKKILCASTAFDNTIVLVRLDQPCQQESIVHMTYEGKILFERQYNDIIDTFGMMNKKQVIVCNVPENKIDIVNLENKSVLQVDHQYLFEDTASIKIFCFEQSNLFCIVEFGGLNDHRLKLSYFSYPDIKSNSEPVVVYESKDNEWTYDHEIQKINNHSKIGWWTYNSAKDITFTYFEALEGGRLRQVTSKSNQTQTYGVQITLSISYLWEVRPNIYMLVALSNKYDHREKCKNKNGVLNNNYLVDATIDMSQAILTETPFDFGIEQDQFSYNDQLTDCFIIGDVSVFHSFRHKDGKPLTTPVYFVSNETNEVIFKDYWESICYQSNYFFPGWDSGCMIRATHTNGDCDNIIINAIKAVNPKQIALSFLLQLNEDFQDDLLMDVITLLVN